MWFKAINFRIIWCGLILAGTVVGCSNYNGEQLFHTEGCITCHRFKGTGGYMGPDLTAISQIKNDNYIHNYLKNPKQQNQQARMPSFTHLSKKKRNAIISFLKKQHPSYFKNLPFILKKNKNLKKCLAFLLLLVLIPSCIFYIKNYIHFIFSLA